MKTASLFLLSFLSTAAFCPAETTVITGVWSRYMSNASIYLDKPVLQTIVITDLTEGAQFTIFHSIGLNDADPSSDYGDEIDWKVSFAHRFGMNKAYCAEFSVAYWDAVDLFQSKPIDVIYQNASLSRSISGNATAKMTVEAYQTTDRRKLEGGMRFTFEALSFVSLGEKAKLSYSAGLVRDNGTFRTDPGWLMSASAGIDWIMNRFVINFPRAAVVKPLTRITDGRGSPIAWGGGLSFQF